jgi:chromosome segregation protein
MRLKRVKIFGFKTFADRTEFSLAGGVIAVVGPNGCGKSNLVDAILWGLGEGNARQLRAQTGQDVIFSGSSRRKPVGFAEVSLLFDNEDRALPLEADEVSISRKLSRSGESEYSINRQTCRLRDIYDLLADSGLGRAGYAIVGQKEIDAALSASAEDRRAWVDEAAGVQRYRARKVESLRRLATAQEHLERIADIVRELAAQRAPLEEEAERAIAYKSILGALRDVELGLLIGEVVHALDELRDAERSIAECGRISREEAVRASNLDLQVTSTGERISEIETEMDQVRALQHGSLTGLERAEANIRLTEQKLEGLDELETSLSEDGTVAKERIDEFRQEAEGAKLELQAESEGLDTLRTELSGVGEEANRLSLELRRLEEELRKAREAKAHQLKFDAEESHRRERRKLATRELAGIDASLPELEEATKEAESASLEIEARQAAVRAEMDGLELKIREILKAEEKDGLAVRGALSQRASLDGRRRGIESTILSHEGISQGARAVLEAAERNLIHGTYTPVGEAVEADAELALAVETALGAASNDLIVQHESEAKEAIEWLKQNRAGRATFQPITLMRPPEPSHELRRLLGERGILGRASELVRCDSRFRPVIDSLLGRVLIVEDIDLALRHARTSGWSRMVTLDGEVVHSGGAVTGGRQANTGYGLVQRKADLQAIEEEIAALDKTVREFESRTAGRSKHRQELDAALKNGQDRTGAIHRELQEARSFHRTLADELKGTARSRERLVHEIEQLSAARKQELPQVAVELVEAQRDGALKELASRSADAEGAESRLKEAEARLSQAQARRLAAERRLQVASDSEGQRKKRLEGLEPERQRIRDSAVGFAKDRDSAKAQRAEADTKLSSLQTLRRELLEKSLQLAEDAKQARENASQVGEASHQAELTRARAENRRSGSLQRLMEDYGLSEPEALAQQGTHEIPPDAQAVVNRLRRDLRGMGDVNLGAIDAYQRLSARLEELQAQQADVLGGIEQVEASIAELDKMTRDRFLNTFLAVQEAFVETFQKLFGGGEGKMSLSDPNLVLDSGIELEIQLPGKRRQPLNLLSGGERALCASAFLFALLRVKPSPLVVLDEVDAPLDGRNVERFAEMLHEHSDRTQFIVITHNMSTIISAQDWLGVTMQEPGISTLLPVRLPEAREAVQQP